MIYNEIFNFCKVKAHGNMYKNTEEIPPRVDFLIKLLDREGIKWELDKHYKISKGFNFSLWRHKRDLEKMKNKVNKTRRDLFLITKYEDYLKKIDLDDKEKKLPIYNLILPGNSDKMICAHHDIVNVNSDNANDNSASVINAIALKKLRPDLNVVLVDGEECGGVGSSRISQLIKEGKFGNIQWVLNLELTGIGGENFFIGNYPGKLFNHIKSIFDCPVMNTPFNDSVIFRSNGIDSVVINPLPVISNTNNRVPDRYRMRDNLVYNGNVLDSSILGLCHSNEDSLDKISTEDMRDFVEKVLLKIV